MKGNPDTIQPFALVENIANRVEFSSAEDAILIAKTEILCLHDLSLDTDVANDVSLQE
jgi:hypothetical protein